MIKIIVIVLCFQYGMMEAPVNTYLPSGKTSLAFSKTYAPPTHNVSFNFGYSPSKTENKFVMDSSPSGHDSTYSPATRGNGNSYKTEEMIGTFDRNPVMTQLLFKNSHNVQKNVDLAKDSYSTKKSDYNTPKYLPNIKSDLTHGTYSDKNYPLPAQTLPQINENKFARNHPDQPNSIQQFHDTKSGVSLGTNSFEGYRPSIRNMESDYTQDTGSSYDFSYDVISPETGVNHGHRESFDGKTAEGVYHNLLPDGRLLTVEYWADESGFKPRISYKILNPSTENKNEGPY